ncbi:MAG: Hsp20/alpha crystallin family protein [Methanopyri archaeon]|nr:Hsp20/alpha crystallin family protein [Methanopyri archaeon]
MVWYCDPFKDMRRMQGDMDRIFRGTLLVPEVSDSGGGNVSAGERFRNPLATLRETEEGFEVTAEIPGASKEEIDLQVNPDSLVIKTDKKEEKEETSDEVTSRYSSYRGFYKAIGFPVSIDPEKAKASYENGVLKVTVPRLAESKGRKLLIE